MSSANVLNDDPDAYTYIPRMVSPVSDSPCNPDSVRIFKPMEDGTVNTVPATPSEEMCRGEKY